VAVLWRKSSKSIQYDYLEDGWHASGKGLEQSRHSLIRMVDWLLASSDILPFSMELPNDEHAHIAQVIIKKNQVFDPPAHMRPHEPDPLPPCGRPHAVDMK